MNQLILKLLLLATAADAAAASVVAVVAAKTVGNQSSCHFSLNVMK